MRTPLPKNFIVKDLIAGLVVFLVAVVYAYYELIASLGIEAKI